MPDDNSVVLSSKKHSYLLDRIGDDIITASGLTLLGADDKAGVAIIMNLAELLMNNPQIIHGDIRVLFTPDEEIGQGVDKIDMQQLNADFGYTLDGGERGHLEGETFSADGCKVVFHGISAHPGYAKNKMVSAIKVASYFNTLLPNDILCPEKTDKYEGFVHPVSIDGGVEKATVGFIVRDFETAKLKDHEELLNQLAQKAVAQFEGATFEIIVTEQYRNMKEILDQFPQVMANAEEAYKRAGLNTVTTNIRGGTDGSRLSFMGLPWRNGHS
jgi:tripeptide aminopeptidase